MLTLGGGFFAIVYIHYLSSQRPKLKFLSPFSLSRVKYGGNIARQLNFKRTQ